VLVVGVGVAAVFVVGVGVAAVPIARAEVTAVPFAFVVRSGDPLMVLNSVVTLDKTEKIFPRNTKRSILTSY